jgi:hypothetical protein
LLTLEELGDIRATENWHFRYGERRTGSSGPGTVTEGEVY